MLLASVSISTALAQPRVFIASDSTAADYGTERLPQLGWGQVLHCSLAADVEVRNHAKGGRSTRTFIEEGRFDAIAREIAPGDTLLIQFGHNDESIGKPERYIDPEGYRRNLARFVQMARDHGATPVLITPVTVLRFEDGRIPETHPGYTEKMIELAQQMQVPLVDLDARSRRLFESMGEARAQDYFLFYTAEDRVPRFPDGWADNIHFNEAGARLVAGLVADGLAGLDIPLAAQVRRPELSQIPQLGDPGLCPTPASVLAALPWHADLGDGRYRNPILAADYSDPDVVRVGEDFYLTASSFSNVPGLPILHSRDLVNWTIIGHALGVVTPEAHFRTPRRGGGVWAPAIRHHDGRFHIYYPDPDHGIFLVTAAHPAGPWSAPQRVLDQAGVIDPAPFWDEDGQGWLVVAWAKSRAGINNIVTLYRLSDDGASVTDEGRTIIDGGPLGMAETSNGPMPWRVIEGPKLYRRDGWYYVFAPAGGVKPGWQAVFRSRQIDGPYEARIVMDQGRSAFNGPHQGAWVDTPGGESWFLHFQDTDSYGRRVLLEPMQWIDGWPVIGRDPDGDGRGEPVDVWRKPDLPPQPVAVPQMGDEFDGELSLAWQWNSNPAADWADLEARRGWLRLKSVSASANLYEAGNVLTQKLPGPRFTATTRMRFQPEAEGEQAGLILFGDAYAWIGLRHDGQGTRLVQLRRDGARANLPEQVVAERAFDAGDVYLRLSAEPVDIKARPFNPKSYWPSELRETHAKVRFSYSLDGERWHEFGKPFISRPGRWVGAQLGLFAAAAGGTPSNVATSVGYAEFDHLEIRR